MYYAVLQGDDEWSSRREGTVIEARTTCEESVMQTENGDGASTSVYVTICVTTISTISISSNAQVEKVKKFIYTDWTKYLVNQQPICTINAQVRLTLERF